MAMKDEFMFLTVLVPGPSSPKMHLDIFLQPLIAELNHLWEFGTRTYDIHKRQNFQLKAALMWTINDFPAYSMLSGWSTSGQKACPHCMEKTDAFTLPKSRKQSWFDCHRKFLPDSHTFRNNTRDFIKGKKEKTKFRGVKTGSVIITEIDRLGFKKAYEPGAAAVNEHKSKSHGWHKKSIFWDLPYWETNLIRHNLDVMHIEKNVFDNIFNTVLNVPGKTKDHAKSREELNDFCERPDQALDEETGKYPKASYALDTESKKILLEWVRNLKFPDGQVSNLGRCVDQKSQKMTGMKTHDCHVFMQRLLPVAFRELLPKEVWEPITELSIFFKQLTCTSLNEADLIDMEKDIAKILCKLERFFPPSFFDSMEHLPVHLPYEAKIAGPVQYRWMYPFERYLGKLKKMVTNKAKVEGSIANGYMYGEITKFASFYFNDGDPMLPDRMGRNETRDDDADDDYINYFKRLRNIVFFLKSLFVDELNENNPGISEREIIVKLEREFPEWFQRYAQCPSNRVTNPYISSLAQGPLRQVKSFLGYIVNGFKFRTQASGENQDTMNSGVCVKGSLYGPEESDFYGILTDVIELEYPAMPIKKTVLFKCDWFDPTNGVGMTMHSQYNIVDVNHTRKYRKYEPFILAGQSGQVHYCSYPSKRQNRKNWWSVCRMKAKSEIDMPEAITPALQEDIPQPPLNVITNEEPTILVDPEGEVEVSAYEEADIENEEVISSDEEVCYDDDDDDDID
ncbi:uncharacterized protein LOC126657155 [Mercurialis annua]|uniref:uncharacterized protein LOC126657155 n=1 Tax=Mercurialis annua TaxID=3986 RepID=UPI00215ECB03|nr:uncharacterized protein LOC126657155 [Mercurialis annua]